MAGVPVYECSPITRPAAADLSSKQFHFGVINSSNQIAAVASQGTKTVHGVIQNDPDTPGEAASLALLNAGGVMKVIAGATIAAEAEITTGADGRAEEAASGDFVIGVCLTGGADGEAIEFLPGSFATQPEA